MAAAGVPLEIVPGITAALAAGSYAGIMLTHRDEASAVALVTGRETDDKQSAGLDFAALAAFPGTLVFYMGLTTAGRWTAELIAHGKPSDTPAAIVRRCSWPDQTVIQTTLGRVSEELTAAKMRPPVIVIVGSVAAATACDWFASRPLFGQQMLVTRPLGSGGNALQPARRIGGGMSRATGDPNRSAARIGRRSIRALARLNRIRLAGVFQRQRRSLFARAIARSRRRFAAAWRACGWPRWAPAPARNWPAIISKPTCSPSNIERKNSRRCSSPTLAAGDFCSPEPAAAAKFCPTNCIAAGAIVEQIVVYTSTDVPQPDAEIAAALSAGRIDWITVTSSAIARSLAQMFGEELRKSRLASISPITSATLRTLGHEPAAEATEYTMDGVVRAIEEGARD